MQTPCVRCIFRPRPLTNNTVRSLFVGPRPFWIGIIRKISKSQLRSVSALRAKTVRKPHGLETTRARYSFLNFGSVPSCALFGLVLVFWHRFDGSWCYCGLLGFHAPGPHFYSNTPCTIRQYRGGTATRPPCKQLTVRADGGQLGRFLLHGDFEKCESDK